MKEDSKIAKILIDALNKIKEVNPMSKNIIKVITNPRPPQVFYNTQTFNTITSAKTTNITKPRYRVDENPTLTEGEVVEVDLSYFNIFKEPREQNIVEGVVVGRTLGDLTTVSWIIDFGFYVFGNGYPFKVCVISPQAICKPEKLEWEQ